MTPAAKEWLKILTIIRKTLRRAIDQLDEFYAVQASDRRKARKLRATGNRFDERRAVAIEELVDVRDRQTADERARRRDLIRKYGEMIVHQGQAIDAVVPRSVMLDFLEINQSDRPKIEPDAGIVELTFAYSLEQSAYYRKDGWKKGPFAQALTEFFTHEMRHNAQLRAMSDEFLFGKDGLFEFLPRYKQNDKGEMVRQPPPLRLA